MRRAHQFLAFFVLLLLGCGTTGENSPSTSKNNSNTDTLSRPYLRYLGHPVEKLRPLCTKEFRIYDVNDEDESWQECECLLENHWIKAELSAIDTLVVVSIESNNGGIFGDEKAAKWIGKDVQDVIKMLEPISDENSLALLLNDSVMFHSTCLNKPDNYTAFDLLTNDDTIQFKRQYGKCKIESMRMVTIFNEE